MQPGHYRGEDSDSPFQTIVVVCFFRSWKPVFNALLAENGTQRRSTNRLDVIKPMSKIARSAASPMFCALSTTCHHRNSSSGRSRNRRRREPIGFPEILVAPAQPAL